MRSHFHRAALFLLLGLIIPPGSASAQADETWRSWNQPVNPFRIIGNIYYVGASDITSFLITTPGGHILLDSGFAETVPLIEASVKKLGFNMRDIKILINSHAHNDHAGGMALLKEMTGAKLCMSEADSVLIANGGKGDFQWGDSLAYRPVTVDRRLRDKDKVELGGVTMIARLTPGHTKGSTTWTTRVEEGGKRYDVIFAGSTTAPGYRLVNNPNYPNIVDDYVYTFRLLKSLPCDVFLAPHGSFFSLGEKMRRIAAGEESNPFIDPAGYQRFIKRTESAFLEQLRKEQQSKGQ
jgi:metallo-beta-lactamase class B